MCYSCHEISPGYELHNEKTNRSYRKIRNNESGIMEQVASWKKTARNE